LRDGQWWSITNCGCCGSYVACSSCNIKHARNSTALTAESERVKQPRRRRACRLRTLAVQHLRAQI
jgi:hypothetical protein